MNKLFFYAFVIIGLITVSGCSKDPSVIENLAFINFLTSEQLTELFTGNTIISKNLKSHMQSEIAYKADGTYAGTVNSGAKKVSGGWKVKEGGKICDAQLNYAWCFQVYEENGIFYAVANGKRSSSFAVKK